MDSQSLLHDRAVGAYLGMAVGDALGATVEFMTPAEIASVHGVHDRIVGGGWLKLRPGAVTDDTEMALALGDSILAHDDVVPAAVAQAFSDWMCSKPVDIGNTVRRGIVHYRHSGEPHVPYHEQGAGNGACMRSLPVALATLGEPDQRIRRAVLDQAHVTHHNTLSDDGSLFVVKLTQAALSGTSRQVLGALIDQFQSRLPAFRYHGRQQHPSGFIVDTLVAVFQAFIAGGSFEAALIDVVNRGGDADTTGAILGMIAGAHYGRQGIPIRWLNVLDSDVAQRCERQAGALLALSAAANHPLMRGQVS